MSNIPGWAAEAVGIVSALIYTSLYISLSHLFSWYLLNFCFPITLSFMCSKLLQLASTITPMICKEGPTHPGGTHPPRSTKCRYVPPVSILTTPPPPPTPLWYTWMYITSTIFCLSFLCSYAFNVIIWYLYLKYGYCINNYDKLKTNKEGNFLCRFPRNKIKFVFPSLSSHYSTTVSLYIIIHPYANVITVSTWITYSRHFKNNYKYLYRTPKLKYRNMQIP